MIEQAYRFGLICGRTNDTSAQFTNSTDEKLRNAFALGFNEGQKDAPKVADVDAMLRNAVPDSHLRR